MIDNRDKLKSEAESLGLNRLTDRQLEQFARAKETAAQLIKNIPCDLPLYSEPAHIFIADGGD